MKYFLVVVLLSLAACGSQVLTLSPQELPAQLQTDAVLLDVRSPEEWSAGHLSRAVHLPVGQVEDHAVSLLPDRDAPIYVYCKSGGRAKHAASRLSALGYTQVRAVTGGGFAQLRAQGLAASR